jgi:multiple sugar transport system substrate-binding protein
MPKGGDSMKKILSLILIITLSLVVIGCSKDDKGKQTLTIWAGGQWTGNDATNLQNFINKFNQDNPLGFEVKLSLKTDMEVSFVSALNVGKAPDMLIWDRFNTPTYANQDFLYSIDELIERDNVDTTMFHNEAYKELSYDGKQYGIPLDVDAWGIYVNLDILEEYNTNNPSNQAVVPTTWEELLDTARKLTKSDNSGKMVVGGYSTQDLHEHFFKFLTSTGSAFLGENGLSNFDTTESIATLEFLNQLKNANVSTSGLSTREAFANNMLAMINQPTYFASYLKEYAPELNYKFIAQPKYSGENGVQGGMLGGFGIAIPDPGSQRRDEEWKEKLELSWDFMQWWLCNEENALNWSKESNTLPAITSLYTNEAITSNELLKDVALQVQNYKIRPQIPGYLLIQTNVFNREIPNYLNGKLSITELIEVMSSQSDEIINSYK